MPDASENIYIFNLFFNLNPNEGTLIDSIVLHNENILKNIQTEIPFDGQKIKVNRRTITENIGKNCLEHKNIIISGEGGCGKTAILKEFYGNDSCSSKWLGTRQMSLTPTSFAIVSTSC